MFILDFPVCKSLQCLISTLTQGGGGGHFFRLTCSVVLWGGRNTANKYHWCVLTVIQPHWVCPHLQCMCFPSLHCSGCRLLCQELFEVALGYMHFPGLSCSGSASRVLHKGADLGLHSVTFPGPSSSGDQVLGERSCPQVGL